MRNRCCRHLLVCLTLAAQVALAADGSRPDSHRAPAVEAPSASGPLDGKTFVGALGPDGQPKDIADVFVFENGSFVSKECETRCRYPARPYFTRSDGNRIEFISETRCPYKDASIVWRGTVEGDRISGTSTWVVRRWYWTLRDSFEFEGRLVETAPAPASD